MHEIRLSSHDAVIVNVVLFLIVPIARLVNKMCAQVHEQKNGHHVSTKEARDQHHLVMIIGPRDCSRQRVVENEGDLVIIKSFLRSPQ